MRSNTFFAVLMMLIGSHSLGLGAEIPTTATTPTAAVQAIRDWRELHYGMFIHFGMSTFTGREIDAGDMPSSTYAPTELDVDQWIRVARDAGMRYAVLTAKHVAGHCLWDSKVQWKGREFDYDVATSGNPTDVVGEFVKACKKYDIQPGLYYCLMDGPNGLGVKTWVADQLPAEFFQLVKDQLAELIARYPDVGYYWIDIPRVASAAQRAELYQHIKSFGEQRVVLFNHGLTPPKGGLTIDNIPDAWPTDIINTEVRLQWPMSFTPVQQFQKRSYELGFEHCDKIGKGWFWQDDEQPRPLKELKLLHEWVRYTGGNLLLNVPPDRSGRIPQFHIERLGALRKEIQTGKD